MIQVFYLKFKKILHNTWLSVFFAHIFTFLYHTIFFVKKTFRNKEFSSMHFDESLKLIQKVFPHPQIELDFTNPEINNELDLTIIVTVYNYRIKLKKNIESCINQKTKYNYEIIFVNDGSTDGSEKEIEQYLDNPKVHLINRPNGGLSAARNSGINAATGKYIMFVDCDDFLHNDIVENLMNRAYQENSDIAMCAHNLVIVKDGNVQEVVPQSYPKNDLLGYGKNNYILNYPGFAWGKVYRRELFNHVRYPESYWYEDTVTQFLLFTQCKQFSYVEKPMYDYIWHDKNISHLQNDTVNLKVIDSYWLLIDIMKQYADISLPVDDKLYILLLNHVSVYYYCKVKLLDSDVVEALFVAAKELINQFKPANKTKLPYILRQVEKSFEKNDISLWKLASSYL